VDTQRTDTGYCERRASWDPLGAWADEGGRVFSSATGALILGIYFDYDQVVGTTADGVATASRGSPLPPRAPSAPPELPSRRYPACR
jgi:hypothetical protein